VPSQTAIPPPPPLPTNLFATIKKDEVKAVVPKAVVSQREIVEKKVLLKLDLEFSKLPRCRKPEALVRPAICFWHTSSRAARAA
jgi:hypothetical protein